MKVKKYDLYPIIKGCSTECEFTGTLRQCTIYAKRKKTLNKNFDYILLPEKY